MNPLYSLKALEKVFIL